MCYLYLSLSVLYDEFYGKKKKKQNYYLYKCINNRYNSVFSCVQTRHVSLVMQAALHRMCNISTALHYLPDIELVVSTKSPPGCV